MNPDGKNGVTLQDLWFRIGGIETRIDAVSSEVKSVREDVREVANSQSLMRANMEAIQLEVRHLLSRQSSVEVRQDQALRKQGFIERRIERMQAICESRSKSSDKHRAVNSDTLNKIRETQMELMKSENTGRFEISMLKTKAETTWLTTRRVVIILLGMVTATATIITIIRAVKGF